MSNESPLISQQQHLPASRAMGSLRHETRHHHLVYRNSPVPSMISATKSPSTGCSGGGGGGKEPAMNNNESMDSGVAGLRDGLTTPHGGSPTSATSSNQPTVAVTLPSDDGLQYIVDRSKSTTYLKGRFLGKVRSY